MGRLTVEPAAKADGQMGEFVEAFARRVEAMPPGQCPVGMMLGQLQASMAQTCGKCTPCAQGMPKIAALLRDVAEFRATEATVGEIRAKATLLRDTADCAVGWQAGQMVLEGLDAFADEFASHVEAGTCAPGTRQTVPCVTLCPAHVNVPAYIALAEEGRFAEAVKMIRKDNPFPTACALVCEHPCEERCRRTMVDAPVNIRGIKKYIVDTVAADTVETPAPLPSTGKRVAVVGAGPSGLTCAYFLALMGHEVVVHEARKKLGGMMRYGIPAYRFPRERLDEDIRAILGAGSIEVKTECAVDAAEMAKLAGWYDAVYVAIGAQGGKTLALEGADAEGVMSAVDLLGVIGDGEHPDFTGKKVVVIGGGNVAMDCARTSVRLGAESVTVAYRRRLEDMTALPAEVESAIAEGVEMMCLQAPERIEVDAEGRAAALVCQPQRIGAVKRGRPAPVAADKPELRLEADIVLIAVGQAIESAPFEEYGMEADRTYFVADQYLRAMGQEGVFVGGDCQWGPKTVIMAIAAGKTAAANIDHELGFHHELDCGAAVPPARPNDRTAYGRVQVAERPACERKHDFEGVEVPMTDEEAAQECRRCLRCDVYGIGALTGRGLEVW
ncbi:glutamate synthase [Adlercreutzia equolifaciens subsp. celatus]|uniref:Glutamate synthase n=1 Tax=Adlercreutzia equolifaciens subsp. celatus DSM 18785 TaxID=1121021 RepID=A0A3N0AXC5_9ACTN|nr:NAD(P)-binding protein [Adlercreutzia equolifaciens]MCP2077946.1 NADPH-dependent glutamate synthase beta chain [Adlercreutzia equolifaciens subsp. celatus DSM 18785]RFT94861.1 glutamate synthase [Adlercreutzia equolifaciens subsp. celatus]RNL39348.1 glutamate synthase [Adlercreutzia equolifaciens subsp. celatus DSM 18785]BCS58457.1 glutamate synthase [Adlercreutzia equolifaciens subsp. celatus]